jgi:hypothetical protein
MGDVQMAFEILTCCFVQHPSYLLWCTPLISTFTKSFFFFYSSFLQLFGHLLSPGSFDTLEGPLAHKQASLLITFDCVRLISTSTVAPTTYLGSWVLVILVIVTIMVDHCPFLLETLTQIGNNTFFFQQHLKATCDLWPCPVHACLLPLKQFIGQQMVQLQDSILKRLHHHTLSSMLSDRISDAIMPKFIMLWPNSGHLAYNSTNLPILLIILSNFFSTTLRM